MGDERYPNMAWQARTREETQRKTVTDVGRRDTEDPDGMRNGVEQSKCYSSSP